MKKNVFIVFIFIIICGNNFYSQTNNIAINASLNTETKELNIQQTTVFYNKSNTTLNSIYFHNWSNAYKDKKTPLAKRFVEGYSKAFHFTNEKNRGHSFIKSISVNYDIATWKITEDNPDILKVNLSKPLHPKDSVTIVATYTVKIPKDRFTNYGFNLTGFNLKYWYLIPAVFENKWITYNNLDLDDLYMDFTNYSINIKVPNNYYLNSDIVVSEKNKNNVTEYLLKGYKQLDIPLNISQQNSFIEINSSPVKIITNLNSTKLNSAIKTDIVNRELYFIQQYLGKFPFSKLLIDKTDYDKNPVYGLNQLPSFLAPFSDIFEWDIKLFKILTKKYIDNILVFNKREDAWLADGLQTYLMLKYVETFYPEVKAIGNISKLWGIRNFNLAKINFNDKYPFVYQFAARKNLDQALTTRADSLSNFNQKIVNKYKAGLGLQYLEAYLSKKTVTEAIQNFSTKNSGNLISSKSFLNYFKTSKDLSWFKRDYLTTLKKIDYKIKNIQHKPDSLIVGIKNKRKFTAPIQLYGINNGQIKFKTWLTGIDSITKITIPKNGYDQLSLNYESLLPEYNLRNNWKNVNGSIFNKPVQIKFLKDIENPYYNQLFYTPILRYNYYDGAILGLALSNKTLLRKSFTYKITPAYSTKSKTFSGIFSMLYENLPENKKVDRFLAGVTGSNFLYAENLSYTAISPFALIEFKRKKLRDVETQGIVASYTFVDREKDPNQAQHIETNKYGVFNLSYGFSKPEIIEDIRFSAGIQFSKNFSKASLTGRYRILTDTNRQFDFRIFAGAFLTNKTETDYFSFALDRPTDYLFQYEYLGRSETTGFFSQQIIINEGGFKSKLPVAFANEWLTTINTNVGLWRWFEIYNDVGFVKNKGKKVYFAYENGVRLNFIQDILEVYFPFYSNLGWELSQPQYSSKIRFVLVVKPKRIYNFIRRGFY